MIYLLEDDESIRKLVTYTLQHAGYEAAGFERPSAFWAAMKRETPELVLLDIMLPEEDGLSVLGKLRGSALWRELPVVMLTAKNAEYDRVVGLDAGADDYISKPFGMMELLARVRALLRRTGAPTASDHTVGELYVCRDKHIVRVSGQDVPLTNKEFSLLCLLLEHSGAALTRDRKHPQQMRERLCSCLRPGKLGLHGGVCHGGAEENGRKEQQPHAKKEFSLHGSLRFSGENR